MRRGILHRSMRKPPDCNSGRVGAEPRATRPAPGSRGDTKMVANNGNGNSNRVTVSVRSLINNRSLTKPQRAFIGKRVKHGEIELELTDKLIALAVGCSVGYLHAAEKCSEG